VKHQDKPKEQLISELEAALLESEGLRARMAADAHARNAQQQAADRAGTKHTNELLAAQTEAEERTARAEEARDEATARGSQLVSENAELATLYEALQGQNALVNAKNVELATLKVKADEASRLKSDFLANMSHELRTPLNAIIGFTELVMTSLQAHLDDRSAKNLDIVLRNAEHLLAMVNDILDLAKVEAGRTVAYAEPIDLQSLLSSIVLYTEPLARKKGISISFKLEAEKISIVTDEMKLRQIISNLVSNAVKFTQAGEVVIEAVSKGPDRFAITVRDTGVGIAPEHKRLIFEDFRQVDSSTTRPVGGTGLGLPIASRLAVLLGGEITIESELGKGSTFTVELPRALPGYVVDSRTQAVLPHAILGPHSEKLVVVAIDDDPDTLLLLIEKLKDSDYVVVPASSAQSGIELAKKLNPYAITLDIIMPKQDGWMVLRELKDDPTTADIPVIILSFVDNKVLGFGLGASKYLSKPVDRGLLLSHLDSFKEGLRDGNGYVLVVDDDPDARNLYRQLLEKEHIQVVEAQDGAQAIELIKKEAPLLVLLDIMMPKMDGFDVVAWLRNEGKTLTVPVVIVTAKDLMPEDLHKLAETRRVIRKGDHAPYMVVDDVRALLDRNRVRK
jgi:signal transduction histidine kinase/CheY-like chemotaxis protein